MTWREEYQPGSFRGVGFRSQNHEAAGGRRVVTHEFPGRDEPLTEDLGGRARTYNLQCHVRGPEYFSDRDAFEDALFEEGPGVLIHPWKGSMQVVVLDYTYTESTDAGGIAYFTVTFGDAGLAVQSPGAIDGKAQAISIANGIDVGAPAQFADGFSIKELPAFVEMAASDIITAAVEVTQIEAGVGGGVGPALRAFDATLRFLPDSLANLLKTPLALGQAVHNMILAVEALSQPPRRKAAAFLAMLDYGENLLPVQRITPARIRQDDNRSAVLHLYRLVCATALVRTATKVTFTSYDDAAAFRDRVAHRLDVLALTAADAGEDARAEQFDQLRRAMVRDITQRGGSLARVYKYDVSATQPALAIANRLYGHALAESRANDITHRNRIPHPGFVSGGAQISVLSEADTNG